MSAQRSTSTCVLVPVLALLSVAAAGCGAGESSASSGDPLTGGLVILADAPPESIGPISEDGLVPARPYYHDFGDVKEGDAVSHVFRLQNSGNVDINVTKITAGCGCTVPRIRYTSADGEQVLGRLKPPADEPVLSIPPGVVAECELQVDTKHVQVKNSDKTTTVILSTDSPASHYLTLEVHVYVVRRFNQVPTGIAFGRVPTSAGSSGSTQIVQADVHKDRITEILSVPDGLTAELIPSNGRLWTLEARLNPPLEIGVWTGEIELATESPDGQPADPLTIGIRADIVSDIMVNPTRLVFAARADDSQGEVVVTTLLPGHRLRMVDAVLVEDAHAGLLEVTYEAVEPDARGSSPSWTVRVRSVDHASMSELLRGQVRAVFDDPQHPEAIVTYVIHPAS
jgi:hypothetical protein